MHARRRLGASSIYSVVLSFYVSANLFPLLAWDRHFFDVSRRSRVGRGRDGGGARRGRGEAGGARTRPWAVRGRHRLTGTASGFISVGGN